MSPELQSLVQLQHFDTLIADAKARIAAHPARIADADARIQEAERVVTEATERLKASQEHRRAVEKDAAVYQARLAKYKEQLSAVKTNREYQAMQHEIEAAQQELGAAEEKVLERMMESDQLTADIKKAETERAARRKAIEAEKAEMNEDLQAATRQLTEKTAARDALVKAMPAQTVALFDQVARVRKGVALSAATLDGLCSQCHVRLRPPVFQQVRMNDHIVQCDSCQRIMYYVPPPPPIEHPVTHAP